MVDQPLASGASFSTAIAGVPGPPFSFGFSFSGDLANIQIPFAAGASVSESLDTIFSTGSSTGLTSSFGDLNFTDGASSSLRIAGPQFSGVEIEIASEAELAGIEIDVAKPSELSGIEIDTATDGELTGIEIGAGLVEDLAHPEWSGTAGLTAIQVNTDFTVDFTVGSSASDSYGKAFYEIYLGIGTLTADSLFIEGNFIGAISFGSYRASKLRDGTFVTGATTYTAGVRLVDEFRNTEAQTTLISFTTITPTVDLIDAPGVTVVDNEDSDSVTVTLDTVSSDINYDHTNIYLLQGPTSEPGYKVLIGVLTSAGDFLTFTGLVEGQQFKIVAVSVTVGAESGFISIIGSVIIGSETNIPRLPDGTVASRFPTVGGDNIGKGMMYPIQLEEGDSGARTALSRGTDRLQEAIIYTLRTRVRENLMNLDLGSGLFGVIFHPQSEFLSEIIPDMVRETIEAGVPRVTIVDVQVSPSTVNEVLLIEISWKSNVSNETGNILFPFDQVS